MFSKDPNQKIDQLTKQIPALSKIPYSDRLTVFKSAFSSVSYKIFLFVIFVGFVLVFYFNLDNILEYKGLERGGLIARSLNFFKELGSNFFLPLMAVVLALVLGRNYFVKKQIEKYLEAHKNS